MPDAVSDAIAKVVADQLHPLVQEVRQLREQLADVTSKVQPAPQPRMPWETMAQAIYTRRVARETLLKDASGGHLRAKQEPGPGGRRWLFAVSDLDDRYPVQREPKPG